MFRALSVIPAPAYVLLGQAPAGIQALSLLLDPRWTSFTGMTNKAESDDVIKELLQRL